MTYLCQVNKLNASKIILDSLSCKRATTTIVTPSFRLYSGLGHVQFDNRERKSQTSHLLCSSRCNPILFNKTPCRTIIISKIFTFIGDTWSKGVHAIPDLLTSSPVTGIKNLYIWTEATTGLPWWVTIVLTTSILRAALYVPAAIKLEQLTARRENFNLEVLPAKHAMEMAGRSHEAVSEYLKLKKDLIKERKCQQYKTFLTVSYQVICITAMSVGLRNVLLFDGGSGLRESTLPWGVQLGFPDSTFVLPVTNFLLNLIMVEVDAQKMKKERAEVQMLLNRSIIKGPKYDDKVKRINIHVRRAGCLIILSVYILVPSAMNLCWTTMIVSTIMTRLALQHPSIRRRFGIERRVTETEHPYREFLAHLGRYFQLKSKTGLNK